MPFEGPKSKAAIQRWLAFWKAYSAYFKDGYLLHLVEPDGEQIDAVMHVLDDGRQKRVLVVAYNPAEIEQAGELSMAVPGFERGGCAWSYTAESGVTGTVVEGGRLPVTVPPFNATWYELVEMKQQGDV